MRHRLYIHLVWTTRARGRLIDATLARFLCRFLRAMGRKERAYILEIGMVQTHVHVLARVHPTNRPRGLDAVRAYLRQQPIHHPAETIVGWQGDTPEYDQASPG